MVAVRNCDMMPERIWLRRLLPHVLQDHTVAIANIPHSFYDFPPHDAAGQLSTACHMCNLAATQQDFHDGAWCSGSGSMVRQNAIDRIGGFPITRFLEDMTSATWKSVLISEPLQWGTVPDSFARNIKQMKWYFWKHDTFKSPACWKRPIRPRGCFCRIWPHIIHQ